MSAQERPRRLVLGGVRVTASRRCSPRPQTPVGHPAPFVYGDPWSRLAPPTVSRPDVRASGGVSRPRLSSRWPLQLCSIVEGQHASGRRARETRSACNPEVELDPVAAQTTRPAARRPARLPVSQPRRALNERDRRPKAPQELRQLDPHHPPPTTMRWRGSGAARWPRDWSSSRTPASPSGAG